MHPTIKVEKIDAKTLFVTEEFRASPWVAGIADGLMLWVTDDPMPPGHFGTYFGALTRRTYPNRHIQDLYHLHECVHVRSTAYRPTDSWLAWSRKMIQAEFEASIVSECTAYARIPGLREKTFPHEIWVDRFMPGGALAVLDEDPAAFDRRIREERVRALNAPQFDDFLEHQIWNYCRQNVQWCRIWTTNVGYGPHAAKPAFRAVEEHMAAPDRDERHEAWLAEVTPQDSHIRVPFLQQGDAFAPVYKKSGEEFGNGVLLR